MRSEPKRGPVAFTPLHWFGSLLAAFRQESNDPKHITR
jgi:hypothetical protein